MIDLIWILQYTLKQSYLFWLSYFEGLHSLCQITVNSFHQLLNKREQSIYKQGQC